mmetsp:Transcript_15430/g.20102  ORF Transcript_15430/g.20102 Transcript_15430/m.20102 type:complete len:365 (+) Transcript_15430:44-1138(+)
MPPAYFFHTHLLESNIAALKNDLDSSGAASICETLYHDRTPLSIAIAKGLPDEIILLILSKSSKSARMKNQDGTHMYPIHTCAKYGASTTVIEALLLEFPHVLETKATTRHGIYLTPLDMARESKSLTSSAMNMLRLPVSHWSNLASYTSSSARTRNVESQKKMERTLNKVKYQLDVSLSAEAALLKKLAELELKVDELSSMNHEAGSNSERKRRGSDDSKRRGSMSSNFHSSAQNQIHTSTKRYQRRGSISSNAPRRGSMSTSVPRRGSMSSRRRGSMTYSSSNRRGSTHGVSITKRISKSETCIGNKQGRRLSLGSSREERSPGSTAMTNVVKYVKGDKKVMHQLKKGAFAAGSYAVDSIFT